MLSRSKTTLLIGRILMGLIFLYSAVSKITGWTGTIQFMESKGFPFAPLFLVSTILVETFGALSLFLNYKLEQGAGLLLLYLIPTTLIFHNFWAFEGQQFQTQILHFFKTSPLPGGC